MPSPFLFKSLNQVAVSIVVVGFMPGEEDKQKGDVNALDIAASVFLESHASDSADDKK